MTARLSKLVTIQQVAEQAGRTYERMRRYLGKLNTELHGMLLVNVGGVAQKPRYALTMESLRRVNESWFSDVEKATKDDRIGEDVSHLSDRVDELSQVVEMQSKAIGELWRKVEKLSA